MATSRSRPILSAAAASVSEEGCASLLAVGQDSPTSVSPLLLDLVRALARQAAVEAWASACFSNIAPKDIT